MFCLISMGLLYQTQSSWLLLSFGFYCRGPMKMLILIYFWLQLLRLDRYLNFFEDRIYIQIHFSFICWGIYCKQRLERRQKNWVRVVIECKVLGGMILESGQEEIILMSLVKNVYLGTQYCQPMKFTLNILGFDCSHDLILQLNRLFIEY